MLLCPMSKIMCCFGVSMCNHYRWSGSMSVVFCSVVVNCVARPIDVDTLSCFCTVSVCSVLKHHWWCSGHINFVDWSSLR